MQTVGKPGNRADHTDAAQDLSPGLYVIATPIGNLGDISKRAERCLREADLIACEDTRTSRRLLDHLEIKGNLLPYHEHSPTFMRERLLDKLRTGLRIALVSDAGTPCLADPGFKLVEAAASRGIPIYAVPGPSSLTAALSIAGLPTDRHYFEGFLPGRQGERKKRFEALKSIDATLVMLESPHRILDSLTDAITVLGDRKAALARELTKRFEEVLRGNLSEIRSQLEGKTAIKGEIVLLVDRSSTEQELSDAQIDDAICRALAELKPSQAAAKVAKAMGLDRNEIYKRVLALKRDDQPKQ